MEALSKLAVLIYPWFSSRTNRDQATLLDLLRRRCYFSPAGVS
jgi:hypothetical protein